MGRDRAAYMREYRKRLKGEPPTHEHEFTERWFYMDGPDHLMFLRCSECWQPDGPPRKVDWPPQQRHDPSVPSFNRRPFTPVPKRGTHA